MTIKLGDTRVGDWQLEPEDEPDIYCWSSEGRVDGFKFNDTFVDLSWLWNDGILHLNVFWYPSDYSDEKVKINGLLSTDDWNLLETAAMADVYEAFDKAKKFIDYD
jgi:hypothetical protein